MLTTSHSRPWEFLLDVAQNEVRLHFMEEPDSKCIPLLLHSFGDGSGFGVYQLCDDVLRQFDSREVIPHLEAALRSEHRGVRYWAAHWSNELETFRIGFDGLPIFDDLQCSRAELDHCTERRHCAADST